MKAYLNAREHGDSSTMTAARRQAVQTVVEALNSFTKN